MQAALDDEARPEAAHHDRQGQDSPACLAHPRSQPPRAAGTGDRRRSALILLWYPPRFVDDESAALHAHAGLSWSRLARGLAVLGLVAACAACSGGGRYASGWNGRRGYNGSGDYGYDVNASRSEARSYRARAARSYPVPGTPDDPWGPYIQEASARFGVPQRWIREVMRQESGGHQNGSDGLPITSGAGAMGLMQVMPSTYDALRRQYRLGPDPYDPHDNIMAGTAYIRDMAAIYGAPGFLAAYNAGPQRLDAYLYGGEPLPDETVNYVASIAPRLGADRPMTGPLAVYAGGATGGWSQPPVMQASYTPPVTAQPVEVAQAEDTDPADRAFDGGGLVTADAPTGVLTPRAGAAAPPAPQPQWQPQPQAPASVLGAARPPAPVAATPAVVLASAAAPAYTAPARPSSVGKGDWGIQVGAFPDPTHTQAVLTAARMSAGDLVAGAQPVVIPVQRTGTLYRGRFVGLSASAAAAACDRLASRGMDCFAVPPGF
ncbi:MAG: lytic transglycosylase domain-containing protein [Proteobacteria bacterium]|nr:lytic transglycosylase domain-containing protein [Pseudomonadota bacterium]